MQRWPSLTAEAVCLARALEAKRPDPVLADPYAARFLRRYSRPFVRSSAAFMLSAPGLVTSIATRHAWIDDRLSSVLANVEQVLILGAGYDSRFWRLPVDKCVFVEVDHPATQRRKRRKVAEMQLVGRPHFVAADLAEQSLSEVLMSSPLLPNTPTAVVWEGVTMYLQRQDVVRTLSALSAFAGQDSHLFLDLWQRSADPLPRRLAEKAGLWGLRVIGEPIRFAAAPAEVPGLLRDAGWRAERVTDVGEQSRASRWPAYPNLVLAHARPEPR